MIILASDTSTKSLSAAIYNGDKPVATYTELTGMTHSQTHIPTIERLLHQAGLSHKDIDLYACTTGPGSYTGIRIGVAATKAMAYASGKGAMGVSTLETLAFPHHGDHRMVCPILDARNRRVFSSAYFAGNPVIPEANRTIEEFLDQISGILKSQCDPVCEILFCGDAAPLYETDSEVKQKLELLISDQCLERADFNGTLPEAGDVAILAARRYRKEEEKGSFKAGFRHTEADPFVLEANYLSPSQAERMKKRG